MAEIEVSDDGGISTVEHKQLHRLWPCVHHDPSVPCEKAQQEAARLVRSGQRPARVISAENR